MTVGCSPFEVTEIGLSFQQAASDVHVTGHKQAKTKA